MSRPVRLVWAAASTTAFSPLAPIVNGEVSFEGIDDSTVRTITLSSAQNLSAHNFTFQGTDVYGNPINEVLAGPNNNTVESVHAYRAILSITTDNLAVGNISVGTGHTGQFLWQAYDYNRSFSSLAVAIDITGTITYSYQTTLDDINLIANPFIFFPEPTLHNAVTDQNNTFSGPTSYFTIAVTASTGAATLNFSYLQQGLKA